MLLSHLVVVTLPELSTARVGNIVDTCDVVWPILCEAPRPVTVTTISPSLADQAILRHARGPVRPQQESGAGRVICETRPAES